MLQEIRVRFRWSKTSLAPVGSTRNREREREHAPAEVGSTDRPPFTLLHFFFFFFFVFVYMSVIVAVFFV